MSKDEIENQHARVTNALGIYSNTMRSQPDDLEVAKSDSSLVRWHKQAPDGFIREDRLGSYTTHIRPGNDSGTRTFVEKGV
jgi:hypothetical protein